MTDAKGDLEEPLLLRSGDEPHAHPHTRATNFWSCVLQLEKAIFGAGMMALPRACALLGAWLGFGMLGLVGALTWYSISHGLVHPAAKLVAAGSNLPAPGQPGSSPSPSPSSVIDYSGLVRTYLGSSPVQLLNAFLLANAIGFSVMYMDVIADVLLGSPVSPGIMVELLRVLAAPDWACQWLLHRDTFLGLFTLLVLAPISLQRDISSLRLLNALGLAALAALGLSLTWLAACAAAQGRAHALPLWPNLAALDAMGSSRLLAALSLLPVVLAADGCHMNVLPMASSMTPFSKGCMDSVVALAMAMASAFYALFALAAYTTFGDALEDDMLKNLNPEAMEPLVGRVQATVIAHTVRIAYVLSLLGSSALNLFPMRAAVFDVVFSDSPGKEAAKEAYFTPLTVATLFLIYVLAVGIPSIWAVIGFVGSVASTGVCYLFPAMMMYTYRRNLRQQTASHLAGAALVFFIGAFVMINGLANPL